MNAVVPMEDITYAIDILDMATPAVQGHIENFMEKILQLMEINHILGKNIKQISAMDLISVKQTGRENRTSKKSQLPQEIGPKWVLLDA